MVEKINVTEFENSQNSIPVPPAVFQHIFHEFKDEKSFLGRCSLVCRAWAYHIRQRLFHEVSFRKRDPSLGDLLFRFVGQSVQEERLRRFIELCSNNHSTIPAAGIRVFTLCGKYEALRLAHAWLSTPISGDTNSNGHAIMADRILCDLKHLKLPDLYWVPLDTLHAICHLQAFSKITQLTVMNSDFLTTSDLLSIIPCFPTLERMTLDDVIFGRALASTGPLTLEDARASAIHLPTTFSHLDISLGPQTALRAASATEYHVFPLSALRTCPGLQEISVPLTSETVNELEYLLTEGPAANTNSIKRCTLQIPGRREALISVRSSEVTSANFQPFVRLLVLDARMANIQVVFEGNILGMDRFMQWILCSRVMGRPCNSQVTEIALNDVRNVLDNGWVSTDPFLPRMDRIWATHPFFRSLKEIRVDLVLVFDSLFWQVPQTLEEKEVAKEQMAEKLRGLLPRCNERGLLRPTVRIIIKGRIIRQWDAAAGWHPDIITSDSRI